MSKNSIKIAIIGGTGLNTIEGVTQQQLHEVSTDFGQPSAAIEELQLNLNGQQVHFYFLPRHGSPHSIAPHNINYRANIAALQQLGITHIIAVNAVGSIDPDLKPEEIVLPEQLIDYTHGRDTSFFDGTIGPLDHFDFSDPFDAQLLSTIRETAQVNKCHLVTGGVYGVTQGPRLETAAEIKRMAQDGATLVGMTLMPEAVLAREAKIAYATLCLVVNPAAGVSQAVITMDEIHEAIHNGMGNVKKLLSCILLGIN